MADTKISGLTSKSTVVTADTTVIVDSADNLNKKVTMGTIDTYISATAKTLTNKTINLTSNVLTGTMSLWQFCVSDGTFVFAADTITLTNKRITPRIGTQTSSATPTPTGNTVDQWNETALATGATFAAPTGTPTDGQKLIIRIKDNGTAQTLAWNAIYRASADLPLPTTTVVNKTMYLGFIYNSADSKWDLLAYLNNI